MLFVARRRPARLASFLVPIIRLPAFRVATLDPVADASPPLRLHAELVAAEVGAEVGGATGRAGDLEQLGRVLNSRKKNMSTVDEALRKPLLLDWCLMTLSTEYRGQRAPQWARRILLGAGLLF